MEIEELNKVYGLYFQNNITTAFETKEDVEDYLCSCGNVISCYNPNEDNWTTSGEFNIIPIDRVYAFGLNVPFYRKQNCNEN